MRLPRLLVLSVAALGACAGSEKEDAKGQVDESAPPAIPTESGKADASQKVVAVDVQSTHPYGNDADKMYTVSLATLPSCAQRARLHFNVLRTEANYDFVSVPATGETFTGDRDNTWTQWFDITGTSVRVRLETDYSITRHGFELDKIEWDGQPAGCPQIPASAACDATEVDLSATPGVCGCPALPVCEPVAAVEVAHHVWRGFNNTTKRVQGTTATYTHPGPADGPETDTVGTVDPDRVRDLVRRAASLGLLQGNGYDHTIAPSATSDEFTITAGAYSVSFVSAQGTHNADVQSLIDELESLFTCGTTDGLTCGAGYVCNQGECIEDQSCVCPAVYDPVCGTNGHTYSNACDLGCAGVGQAHAGECGDPGDSCGTIMGLVCKDDNKCRFGASQFTYPYPDAGGTCVAASYCDVPTDCNGLIHPAVVGAWACNANACEWQAGPAWQTLNHFETANPYTNNMSVWHQVYLPAGAQAMRLHTSRFVTELNYDKLEVWSWKNGAWAKVATYTGTTGPALTEEFAGQYHYLKFVSDSSVTKAGVSLDAEWR